MIGIKTMKRWYFWAGIGFLIAFFLTFSIWVPSIGKADEEFSPFSYSLDLKISQQTTFLPDFSPFGGYPKVIKTVKVMVTAYSSSVWETDSSPFITASGESVRDGIIANNLLPFGTLIKLPEVFGDKVFVVNDRMSSQKGPYHFDVWFPSQDQALEFGAKLTDIEILSN